MRGKIIKNISLFFIAMLFLSSFFFLFLNNSSGRLENYFKAKTVLADDDEEDDEEDEDEDEDDEDDEDDDFQETITEVYSTQISNEIRKETVKNTFFDNDRDGIFDDEDKNPTINDFFIVKDDNRNGIVDEYEQ